MSSPSPLLRLIQTVTTKSRNNPAMHPKRYSLQISCHVKPNASSNREGILAIGADRVDVCVAAVPRKGEANAAVSRVLAQVSPVPTAYTPVHSMYYKDTAVTCSRSSKSPNPTSKSSAA
ncbi:hypothetical protein BO70DRAFT_365564 [Aspergillus heteromorphus CBS 117.55]|uniref:YggU-like protein n=1 Tax=Aspergillus heteromorphus CBS 117.55 TaxID=1448321 RepID=A0A317V7B2_9EURO|nr:uncharacterized protein BO70DRAFT_365564 [Aspergillus heteromorphus CBS 117.55]PWY70254.1 hypothetical protein BO70DRAFT_365564 [Aspergillus heteromorphus CBS 117.55]